MRQFVVVCDFKLFLYDFLTDRPSHSPVSNVVSQVVDMRWVAWILFCTLRHLIRYSMVCVFIASCCVYTMLCPCWCVCVVSWCKCYVFQRCWLHRELGTGEWRYSCHKERHTMYLQGVCCSCRSLSYYFLYLISLCLSALAGAPCRPRQLLSRLNLFPVWMAQQGHKPGFNLICFEFCAYVAEIFHVVVVLMFSFVVNPLTPTVAIWVQL